MSDMVHHLAPTYPQMGKLHFGVLLGWSVVHSTLLWFVVNQLAGAEAAEAKGLDLYSVCCVVGYCMVPQVVFSAVSLLIPRWMHLCVALSDEIEYLPGFGASGKIYGVLNFFQEINYLNHWNTGTQCHQFLM